MLGFLLGSISQGLFWSILAIGVYISFRILDIPDMTVEGAFPLGAAVAATLIVKGLSPIPATFAGFISGLAAGFITGFLQTYMHIPALLSGILVMTGLYSVNLRIMGKSNQALLGEETLLTQLEELNVPHEWVPLVLGIFAVVVVISILVLFMYTRSGLNLRATGDSSSMAATNGINVNKMKIVGLMLSSGLVSLSGALFAQNNGFSDIGMGTGVLVIGLAAIFIAEVLLKNLTIGQRLVTIVFGACIYRLVIDLVMLQDFLPIQAGDIKLLSAMVLAIIIFIPSIKKHHAGSSIRKEEQA